MGRKKALLFPKTEDILQRLGENIRLARLRRNISTTLQAERAGISRPTLGSIEKGSPSVSLGNYVQVLVSLGLEEDLLKVAAEDELGRALQDLKLDVRKRAIRREQACGAHDRGDGGGRTPPGRRRGSALRSRNHPRERQRRRGKRSELDHLQR